MPLRVPSGCLLAAAAVLVSLILPQTGQAQYSNYGRGWNGYTYPNVLGGANSGSSGNYGNGNFGAYGTNAYYTRDWNSNDWRTYPGQTPLPSLGLGMGMGTGNGWVYPGGPFPQPVAPNDLTVPETYLPGPTTGFPNSNTAWITVRLPEGDAQLWLNGEPTRLQGKMRRFDTPHLEPTGNKYYYDLKARWKDGSQTVERTRTVRVYPGGRVTVDFTQPDGADTPPPAAAEKQR